MKGNEMAHIPGLVTAKIRNSHKILVGNPEGKEPLEVPRLRQEDMFKWILIVA
jgi:hypothetical protein